MILGVPLESVQGIQDLSGAEGELGVLFLCSRICGVPLEANRSDRLPLVVRGEVGILLELKQEMGPHLKRRWETRGASRLLAGNSDFISSCDRVSGPP